MLHWWYISKQISFFRTIKYYFLILSGTNGDESVIFLVEANLLIAACDTWAEKGGGGLWMGLY